jgi:glyoxylase-like metal-dependent hydrolase (beta-lactamase superfamily II)
VEYGTMFGLTVEPQPPIDHFYADGEVITFGGYQARPHHTPGHCRAEFLQIGARGRPARLFVGDAVRGLDRPHRLPGGI